MESIWMWKNQGFCRTAFMSIYPGLIMTAEEKVCLSIDSYVPSLISAFITGPEQGRVADYVVMMGYDEHYAAGKAVRLHRSV